MELAIINGTYRDSSTKAAAAGMCHPRIPLQLTIEYLVACEEEWRRLAASAAAETRLLSPGMQQMPSQIRTQGTPLGIALKILKSNMSQLMF
jgi:protein quaking